MTANRTPSPASSLFFLIHSKRTSGRLKNASPRHSRCTDFRLRHTRGKTGSRNITDDFLQHLERCVTGISHPVHLPSCPNYLDILLADRNSGAAPSQRWDVNSSRSSPSRAFRPCPHRESSPSLAELDLEYRWSTRFIFLGKQTALAHISVYRRKWRQKLYGIADVVSGRMSRINQEARTWADDSR